MSGNLQTRVDAALASVRNNRLGVNVVEADMVRDLGITTDGKVRLTVLLSPADNAEIVRDIRQALVQVEGVTDVRVDVKDAGQAHREHSPSGSPRDSAGAASATPPDGRRGAGTPSTPPPRAEGKPRSLPVVDQQPQSQRATVPPQTPVAFPNLGTIIAVSSGKGGVGKSTVATNLAVALAKRGARVGLMDADIYGPNIPRMMGINQPMQVDPQGRIIPLESHGIKLVSIGFLIERDQPAIWRGPIIMKVINQFLRDVAWGELDFLLVDMPPGTGDAQLSLVQATHVTGALIVTTPQDVAAGDALRGAKMFQRVDVPVIGVIENMSWLECQHCGERTHLFGSGGGARLAAELGVPLIGQIPLYPQVLEGGDAGVPIMVSEPDAAASIALSRAADGLVNAYASPAGR